MIVLGLSHTVMSCARVETTKTHILRKRRRGVSMEAYVEQAIQNLNTMIDSYNGYNAETIMRSIKIQLELIESWKRFEVKQ
jgi:hypothetical protein